MSIDLLNKWDDSLRNPGRRENLIVKFLQLLLNNDFTKANDDVFDIGEMFVERVLKQIINNFDDGICRLVYIHAIKVLLKTSNGSRYIETFSNNNGLHITKKLLISLNPVTYKKHLRIILQILLLVAKHSDEQKLNIIYKYKLPNIIVMVCERTVDNLIHKISCSIFCELININNANPVEESRDLDGNNNCDDNDNDDDGLLIMGVADSILRFIKSDNINIQRLGIKICLSVLSGGKTSIGMFFHLKCLQGDDNDDDLEEETSWITELIPHVIKLIVWGNLSSRFEAAELVISLYENLKYFGANFDIYDILIDFLMKTLALKCNEQLGNLVLYDNSIRLNESDINEVIHTDDAYSLLTASGTDPAILVCYILNRIIYSNITQQGFTSTNKLSTQPVAPTSPKPSFTNSSTFSDNIPFSPRSNMYSTPISPLQLNNTQHYTATNSSPLRSPLFRSHTVTTKAIESNLAPLVNNKMHLVLLLYIASQGVINCQLDELNPRFVDKLYEMYISDDIFLCNTTKVHWMESVNNTAPSMYKSSLNLQELDDEDFDEDEGFDDIVIDRSCIDKPESEITVLHRLLRTRGVTSFIVSCKLLQEWINCDTNVQYEIRKELESVYEVITQKNKVEMIGGMMFSHGSRSQKDGIQVIETYNNTVNIFMTMMQLILSKNKLAMILRENLLEKLNINDKINEFHLFFIDLKSEDVRSHLVTQGAVHNGNNENNSTNYKHNQVNSGSNTNNNNESNIKYKKLMDAFVTRVNEKVGQADIPFLSEDEVTAIVGVRVKQVLTTNQRASLFAPKHVANRRNNINNSRNKSKQRRIALISLNRDKPQEENNKNEENKEIAVINELQRMDLDTNAQSNYYQKIKDSVSKCPNVETFVDVYLNAYSPKADKSYVDIINEQNECDIEIISATTNENRVANRQGRKDVVESPVIISGNKSSPNKLLHSKKLFSPGKKTRKSPVKEVPNEDILTHLASIQL
jgi:hypothetical protein